jgi:hypothetical protein
VVVTATVVHCLLWLPPVMRPLGAMVTWIGILFLYTSVTEKRPGSHEGMHVCGMINNAILLYTLS